MVERKWTAELIWWVDSTRIEGWQTLEDPLTKDGMLVVSAGVVVGENTDAVQITTSIHEMGADTHGVLGTVNIPKAAILARKKIASFPLTRPRPKRARK